MPYKIDRNPGHYWVATNYRWVVALWDGCVWHLPGHGDVWSDDDLRAIDEKEITRE